MNTIIKSTPLMEQYHLIKIEYPDSLLFFQVGDFYELFFDDAKKAANFLGIALTKRGNHKGEPVPLCGVPIHTIDHYLQKLVKGGFCVVLCDQLEEAQPGKMVKRGVTAVLTPATLTDTRLLDAQSASYIFSFFMCGDQWGLVFGELLTAQLYATLIPAGSEKKLETELSRFFPQEVLVADSENKFADYFKKAGYFTSQISLNAEFEQWSKEHLNQASCDQLDANLAIKKSLGLLYSYLKKTNESILATLQSIYFYESEDFVVIDSNTQKNLEIVVTQQGSRSNTLLATLDLCKTPMGSRLLKKWIVRPLVQEEMINHRLSVVEYYSNNHAERNGLISLLKMVGDGERIIGKIILDRGNVSDYIQLKEILYLVPQIKLFLHNNNNSFIRMIDTSISDVPLLTQLLEDAFASSDEKGFFIKKGYDKQLDVFKDLVHNSQSKLEELERNEQQKTGIGSLKIRYNSVQGYYVEVTKIHMDVVPSYYIRRQTLANRERYTFAELQELEQAVLHAEQDSKIRERELFDAIKWQLRPYFAVLRKTMHAIAQLDVLIHFGLIAYERGYVKPLFNKERNFNVMQAKHPVLDQTLGSSFIPNDIVLNNDATIMLITGPNMGGKSTYLRQTALIVIMAQCGSFVPAQSANLPLVDKIFTRIGASDNITEGKSTFLVEMEETAHLCHYATEKSLVILDEVGRGTSTFDGLAIAQAVVEYLYQYVKARTLFATHYHELTTLEGMYKGIVNYHATSVTDEKGIVFLHTIISGKAEKSFGIAIAQHAHLPESIIKRAYELEKIFVTSSHTKQVQLIPNNSQKEYELANLRKQVAEAHTTLEILKSVDYNTLSPKQAFDILWKLQE
jgi:DNA mismatch repair protein MutS